jgi:hypothetical protein
MNLYSESSEYVPLYTSTYYLDEKGKVIKEVITKDNKKIISTQNTIYNSDGRISKTVYLNENGSPEMTHIYIYK